MVGWSRRGLNFTAMKILGFKLHGDLASPGYLYFDHHKHLEAPEHVGSLEAVM